MRAFIQNYKIFITDKFFKIMLWKEWNKIIKQINNILEILTLKKNLFKLYSQNPKIWVFTSKGKISYLVIKSPTIKKNNNKNFDKNLWD